MADVLSLQLAALKARLATILTSNGYQLNLGARIYVDGRQVTEVELPAMHLAVRAGQLSRRGETDPTGRGYAANTRTAEVVIAAAVSASSEQAQAQALVMLEDIENALAAKPSVLVTAVQVIRLDRWERVDQQDGIDIVQILVYAAIEYARLLTPPAVPAP